jgi:hypothetical protein
MFGSLAGSTKWWGGVLAPNGMIYGMPFSSTSVLKIDPTTDTAMVVSAVTAGKVGGVLAPNGIIYGSPAGSATVLRIDPTADLAAALDNLSGTNKWYGGVLAPNGFMYGIPYASTTVLKYGGTFDDVPLDFVLSRFFNKA